MQETTSGLDELAQAYDAAMRLWAESCLPEVAVWLEPGLAGLPARAFEKRSPVLVAPVVTADLLLSAGSDRLVHVEYESAPGSDLVQRMFDYRGRMTREFPRHRLSQHVVVLGDGRVRGFDDLRTFGFTLDLRVHYLRAHDPAEFLTSPVLAPFAALGRGSQEEREAALGQAVRLLRDGGHPQRLVLLQATRALARVRLDEATVDRIEKENGMSIQPLVDYYRNTEVGHRLQDLGREEGREEGRERVLRAVLASRFPDGPQVQVAARRLAEWDDEAAAIRAITAAGAAEELLTVEPPPR